MLKCKNCEYYKHIATPGHGVCSMPSSFFPTTDDQDCVFFHPVERICRNCQHLDDMSCLDLDSDGTCPHFISKTIYDLQNCLLTLLANGEYDRQQLIGLCDEFEGSKIFRLISDHIGD